MTYDNLKILENLTEDEKAEVRKILNDISNQGKSQDLSQLYYEDYEEIQVQIQVIT